MRRGDPALWPSTVIRTVLGHITPDATDADLSAVAEVLGALDDGAERLVGWMRKGGRMGHALSPHGPMLYPSEVLLAVAASTVEVDADRIAGESAPLLATRIAPPARGEVLARLRELRAAGGCSETYGLAETCAAIDDVAHHVRVALLMRLRRRRK